jgi:hypothetical protein
VDRRAGDFPRAQAVQDGSRDLLRRNNSHLRNRICFRLSNKSTRRLVFRRRSAVGVSEKTDAPAGETNSQRVGLLIHLFILSGVAASLRKAATESKDPSASSGQALLLVRAKINVERHFSRRGVHSENSLKRCCRSEWTAGPSTALSSASRTTTSLRMTGLGIMKRHC